MRIPPDMVLNLISRSMAVFKNIAMKISLSQEPDAHAPLKKAEENIARTASSEHFIVMSDTENDVTSVKNTLRFVGVLNEKAEFANGLTGVTIFHTGDLLDKKKPDYSVMAYWQALQQEALTKGCHVKLIVGNHEQAIWQKLRTGKKSSILSEKDQGLNDFIEDMDLFHVAGRVLFIHGYPTVEFLQALLHYKEVTGKDLNCFNADHYKKALRSVAAIRQYAYVRKSRNLKHLLYDIADAGRYYKKRGKLVAAVLEQLQIDVVLHGHRPQHSGVQVDYEFGKSIPNIRMIGNDTNVRRKDVSATVIKSKPDGELNIVFINTRTQSNTLQLQLQQELRNPDIPVCASPATDTGAVVVGDG